MLVLIGIATLTLIAQSQLTLAEVLATKQMKEIGVRVV